MPTYTKWPVAGDGTSLEYVPEVLERLRLRTIDALLASPRVKMGVGGLLIGTAEGARVRVSDTLEIPCSHAVGPSFALTGPELDEASGMALGRSRESIVGWYCSRPRRDSALDPSQVAMFRTICPEPWQVGLLIYPDTAEPARAAVCVPDAHGGYAVGPSTDLLEYSVPAVQAIAPVETVPMPNPPVQPPGIRLEPDVVAKVRQASVGAQRWGSPKLAPRERRPTAKAPPASEPLNSPPAARRQLDRIPPGVSARAQGNSASRRYLLLALVAAALLAFLAFLYMNRYSFISRPPLVVTVSAVAEQIMVRWNPAALDGINEGSLMLNDGGQVQTISLNRQILRSGWVKSNRKSDRITAKLTAGDVSAVGDWSSSVAPGSPPVAPSPFPARATPPAARE